jgi:two-component sensor histidine kinase
MRNTVRKLGGLISGTKPTFSLEHRLFNFSSFFVTSFAFIAVLVNYVIGLPLQTIWLSSLGGLVSGSLFYISRVRGYFSAVIVFCYLFVAVGIMSNMYFYNNGMNGTTIYVYLMLLNILVLVMPRRFQYWVFGFFFTAILVLVSLEYAFPEWIIPYHSPEEKMLDHLISLFYSMLFTTGIIVSFRKSYYAERGKTLRRNQELKKLNKKIEEQRKELEEAVKLANARRDNIETLLNELNHRVKNNLQVVSSLLKLQAQSVSDETAKRAILESRNRLSSMILVHKRLYHTEDTTQIYMPEYMQELMESVMQTYQGQVNYNMVSYEVEPVWLKVEKAIPVGLISNELITNCFKHTLYNQPNGKMAITLSKVGEQHMLSIADNGHGFPDQPNKTTFGLELVRSLVSQLNGTYKLKFDQGTRWEIYFN